jgi:hypothetical protein
MPVSTDIDSPYAEVVGGVTCLKSVKEAEWGVKLFSVERAGGVKNQTALGAA